MVTAAVEAVPRVERVADTGAPCTCGTRRNTGVGGARGRRRGRGRRAGALAQRQGRRDRSESSVAGGDGPRRGSGATLRTPRLSSAARPTGAGHCGHAPTQWQWIRARHRLRAPVPPAQPAVPTATQRRAVAAAWRAALASGVGIRDRVPPVAGRRSGPPPPWRYGEYVRTPRGSAASWHRRRPTSGAGPPRRRGPPPTRASRSPGSGRPAPRCPPPTHSAGVWAWRPGPRTPHARLSTARARPKRPVLCGWGGPPCPAKTKHRAKADAAAPSTGART